MSNILEPVLSTILIDMINAQNEANIRSAQLAEEYMKPDREIDLLQFFDIPNASIKSFNLDMKFALESTGAPVTDENKSKLTQIIDQHVNDLVSLCMNKYPLLRQDEKQIKRMIFQLWKKEQPIVPVTLGLPEQDKLLSDINNELDMLRIKVKALIENELSLDVTDHNHNLKAIFSVNDLKSYDGNIMCSISINAEITGMKAGYEDKIAEEEGVKTRKRKIYMIGR